jgi:hypothetical protein
LPGAKGQHKAIAILVMDADKVSKCGNQQSPETRDEYFFSHRKSGAKVNDGRAIHDLAKELYGGQHSNEERDLSTALGSEIVGCNNDQRKIDDRYYSFNCNRTSYQGIHRSVF